MNNSPPWGRLLCILATSLLLGACATQPPQSSIAAIEQQLSEQYPGLDFSATEKSPITIEKNSTVGLQQSLQILLSHSPQVRIQLAELGIADAQTLQAELIENPHLSIGALKSEDGGRWQLDTSLSQPLLALFTRPLRRQLAQEHLLEAQLQLQGELQHLIVKTSELYFATVAAFQHCEIQEQMLQAAMARQQLALSLYRAGNMSENTFLAYDNELRRTQQQLEKRQTQAYEKRLELLNFIGLPSAHTLDLAAQLPPIPDEKFSHSQLLVAATTNRVDIKIAQQQQLILDKRQQLVRQQNGWRDINLGVTAEREFDGAKNYGPELEFALPLFNRGQGKLATLDAQKTKLDARMQKLQLDADSEIAQALNLLSSARAQLTILQPALAVAEKRVQLSKREVNFMLSSPFELLNIKRQQIRLAHEFTDNLKKYWQARARLELAIGQAIPQPDTANKHEHSQMDHSKMGHSQMDHSTTDHSTMNHSEHSSEQHSSQERNNQQEHNHD